MFALVMAQIRRDRAAPIRIARAWSPCSLRPVDRSPDRADSLVLESREQLIYRPPHNHARGLLRLLGNGGPQRHEIGDQVNMVLGVPHGLVSR